jgi:cytochrome d ubiquinol oxidase subunit I
MGLWSLYSRWRGSLYENHWLHRMALMMGPAGIIAVLAGWITTEVGRQPYTIYGLLKTAESASPLAAPAVAASLLAFDIVYFFVFGVGIWFILKLMGHEPHPGESGPSRDDPTRAAGITPLPQVDPQAIPAE